MKFKHNKNIIFRNKLYILNILKLLIINKKYSFNKKGNKLFKRIVFSLKYSKDFNRIIKKFFGNINYKLLNILSKIRLFRIKIIVSKYRIGDGSLNYLFLLE